MIFAKTIKVIIGMINFSYNNPSPSQYLRTPNDIVDIPLIVSEHYIVPNQPNILTYGHPQDLFFSFPHFPKFAKTVRLHKTFLQAIKLNHLPTYPICHFFSNQRSDIAVQEKILNRFGK